MGDLKMEWTGLKVLASWRGAVVVVAAVVALAVAAFAGAICPA
jgi:hypothetical protein